jgi:hypothetical protein
VIAESVPSERPRAVTVIGWTFLVLSLLRFLVDLAGWLAWRFGGVPDVLKAFPPPWSGDPQSPLHGLDATFRHLGEVVALQGLAAACVAVVSYQLLRLRPWARVAMEVVCGVGLAATVAFATFFVTAWAQTDAAARRSAGGARFERWAVPSVVAVTLVIGGLLGLTVWLLRRPDVRRAFQTARD